MVDQPAHERINPKTGRPKGFATPTGLIEIFSVYMENLGPLMEKYHGYPDKHFDPLPMYHEPNISPYSTPMLARQYPLILMTCVRHLPFYHTQFYGVEGARRRHPDPLVEIHPHTAEPLEIANGDWVWIETRMGRIQQRAKLTFGIHPRVICTEHDWWYPERPGTNEISKVSGLPSLYGFADGNSNILTEDDPELCDPQMGCWPHVALLCKIYKVKPEEEYKGKTLGRD
jgi:thiosulfate reductase/polysulfide reductase chain A